MKYIVSKKTGANQDDIELFNNDKKIISLFSIVDVVLENQTVKFEITGTINKEENENHKNESTKKEELQENNNDEEDLDEDLFD